MFLGGLLVNEKGSNQKALKSGLWYTASNFLVKGIGFLTTPIFARILSQNDFGLYNNFLSWLSILIIITTLNLDSTLIRARYDYENTFDEYILSVNILSKISTIIWFLVFNAFSEQFTHFFGMERTHINLMTLYLFFLPSINMFQAREKYYFEYKKTVFTSVALCIITAVLSVLLVLMLDSKLDGRILGYVFPTVIFGIAFDLFFVKNGRKIKTEYWRYALPISLPFILHLLSLTLLNSTDRVMINHMCGSKETALYSLAYTCGAIVTVLAASLNSAYAPWLGEKLNLNKLSEIKKFSYKYISMFSILAIGIMLVTPEILLIIGGNNYVEAKYVMPPVTMGCVCQFIYMMLVNVEQFKKKTLGMSIASLIAALINLGLNFLLIPYYGYIAAAYTTLVGFVCLLCMHMFLVYKIGYKNVYDYRFISLVIVSGLFFTLIINWLYSYAILRYSLLVVYLIGVIILFLHYKRDFYSLIKRNREG